MRPNLLAAAIAVPLSLLAAQLAHAGEGMWVPQQLPEIAGPLKKAGLKLSPQQLSNLTGDPMGAVVALGGCHGQLRVAERPGRDQPPLRLWRDPAELHPGEQPDQERLQRADHGR